MYCSILFYSIPDHMENSPHCSPSHPVPFLLVAVLWFAQVFPFARVLPIGPSPVMPAFHPPPCPPRVPTLCGWGAVSICPRESCWPSAEPTVTPALYVLRRKAQVPTLHHRPWRKPAARVAALISVQRGPVLSAAALALALWPQLTLAA